MKTKKKKIIRVERTHNANTLTESQFFSKIRSALRNAFRYWKPAQIALNAASRPNQDKTNKRLKKQYQCAKCKKWFKRDDVEIDHIIECGSLKCYEDIVPFLKRLIPEDPNAYQILCKKDHIIKTKQFKENEKISIDADSRLKKQSVRKNSSKKRKS